MLAFIIRRLLQAVLVMLTVAFVAFLLFQYVGDPVNQMLGQDATPEDRLRLRAELGLDQPFVVQFAKFVGNAAQGAYCVNTAPAPTPSPARSGCRRVGRAFIEGYEVDEKRFVAPALTVAAGAGQSSSRYSRSAADRVGRA